jgi:hypothetical protein
MVRLTDSDLCEYYAYVCNFWKICFIKSKSNLKKQLLCSPALLGLENFEEVFLMRMRKTQTIATLLMATMFLLSFTACSKPAPMTISPPPAATNEASTSAAPTDKPEPTLSPDESLPPQYSTLTDEFYGIPLATNFPAEWDDAETVALSTILEHYGSTIRLKDIALGNFVVDLELDYRGFTVLVRRIIEERWYSYSVTLNGVNDNVNYYLPGDNNESWLLSVPLAQRLWTILERTSMANDWLDIFGLTTKDADFIASNLWLNGTAPSYEQWGVAIYQADNTNAVELDGTSVLSGIYDELRITAANSGDGVYISHIPNSTTYYPRILHSDAPMELRSNTPTLLEIVRNHKATLAAIEEERQRNYNADVAKASEQTPAPGNNGSANHDGGGIPLTDSPEDQLLLWLPYEDVNYDIRGDLSYSPVGIVITVSLSAGDPFEMEDTYYNQALDYLRGCGLDLNNYTLVKGETITANTPFLPDKPMY